MKPRAAAAVLLLLACAAARAQDKPVELLDEFVGIRFAPPKGAERLGDEETKRDFHVPGGRLKVVFKDPQSAMVLTIDVFDAEAYGRSPGSLNDTQQALRQKLESEIVAGIPGVMWMSRDVMKINSMPWLRLRYKFSSGGGDVVSDMYAIVWGERLVVFNYFCSAGNYERLRADVEKSAASLELFLSFPVENAKPAVRRGKPKRKPQL